MSVLLQKVQVQYGQPRDARIVYSGLVMKGSPWATLEPSREVVLYQVFGLESNWNQQLSVISINTSDKEFTIQIGPIV